MMMTSPLWMLASRALILQMQCIAAVDLTVDEIPALFVSAIAAQVLEGELVAAALPRWGMSS
jgi:hypothetical protein